MFEWRTKKEVGSLTLRPLCWWSTLHIWPETPLVTWTGMNVGIMSIMSIQAEHCSHGCISCNWHQRLIDWFYFANICMWSAISEFCMHYVFIMLGHYRCSQKSRVFFFKWSIVFWGLAEFWVVFTVNLKYIYCVLVAMFFDFPMLSALGVPLM